MRSIKTILFGIALILFGITCQLLVGPGDSIPNVVGAFSAIAGLLISVIGFFIPSKK